MRPYCLPTAKYPAGARASASTVPSCVWTLARSVCRLRLMIHPMAILLMINDEYLPRALALRPKMVVKDVGFVSRRVASRPPVPELRRRGSGLVNRLLPSPV